MRDPAGNSQWPFGSQNASRSTRQARPRGLANTNRVFRLSRKAVIDGTMEWMDQGIVLSARPHGEGGMVVALLTHAHGRHAGFVPGGGSRKARATWQPGNLVEVSWRARLAEQLGNYAGE